MMTARKFFKCRFFKVMTSLWKFNECWNWKSYRKFKKIYKILRRRSNFDSLVIFRTFPNIKTKLNWKLYPFEMNIWYSIQKSIILQSKHWNISNISLSSFRSIRLSQIIPKYLQVNKLLNIIHLPRSTNTTTIVYIYISANQSNSIHSPFVSIIPRCCQISRAAESLSRIHQNHQIQPLQTFRKRGIR